MVRTLSFYLLLLVGTQVIGVFGTVQRRFLVCADSEKLERILGTDRTLSKVLLLNYFYDMVALIACLSV